MKMLVVGRLDSAMNAFCGDNVLGFIVHFAVGTVVGLDDGCDLSKQIRQRNFNDWPLFVLYVKVNGHAQ